MEIEAFIIWNLVKQMEQGLLDPAPVWSNIKTFRGDGLRGKVDGIFAGYPCQPFSLAGDRQGTDDPRHLWPFILRAFKAIGPVFGFFENVSGHISMGYDQVYRDLRALGYRVEAGIFTAEEVGAPHERERLFILAVANSVDGFVCGAPRFPEGQDAGEGIPQRDDLQKFDFSGGLAHPQSSGIQRNRPGGEQESPASPRQGLSRCAGGAGRDRWPAGPGQPQHSWEAPRLESRMGFTVNGYNFREDLLRMAGNGVVPQTAELAFLTLLEKFR